MSEFTMRDLPRFHPLYDTGFHKSRQLYMAEICAFDIETTTLPDIDRSFMYIWQFAIEDLVIIGRTWEEFDELLMLLNACCRQNKLLVFVHNLSYEICFLSGIYKFMDDDVFCTEARSVLKATLDCLEFRCSYKLTNMSLDSLTERYHVKHHKLSGAEFDYNKIRYPWTELTDRELEYCVNDVLGLIEVIHALMDLHHDNVYTLPLTSTGFVRRELKTAMRPYRGMIQSCYPDYEIFKMLRNEFRGGNTHANRYYANEVIYSSGTSYDISSSYPSQLCNKLYPVSPFQWVRNVSPDKIERLIDKNYALLIEVRLYNVRLRDKYYPIPYIPIAKCKSFGSVTVDNGRILTADRIQMVINDIDFQIILYQYCFSFEVVRCCKSEYGQLPSGIIDTTIKYYRAKTNLKGVKGQELYYFKSKELLNSIYGDTVRNPAKALILFQDSLYIEDPSKSESQMLLDSKKRAYLCYQFGCWCTAHARASLEEGIKKCGDNLLYVDTDSCKVKGTVDFSDYNSDQMAASSRSGLCATDPAGIEHYGGVYEFDGSFTSFITLGAKKYCYEDEKGLHITLSGVSKSKGAKYLKEHGGIESFRPGFIFPACGKTESVYHDEPYGDIEIDGHKLYISRDVVIKDKSYTLGVTEDYNDLVEQSKRYLRKMSEILKNTVI